MPHLDPAWLALIGTLCGGIGLKVLEHWLGKSKIKFDESTKLREELRVEYNSMKEDNKRLEEEVDKWKKDWYDLRDKYGELSNLYTVAIDKIKERVTDETAEARRVIRDEPLDPPPAD